MIAEDLPWLQRLRASLSTRIIAWSFIPTFFVLGAVAIYTFFTYWQVTASLVMDRNRQLTTLTAGQLAVEFRTFAEQLQPIVQSRDVLDFDPAYQQSLLRWSVFRLRAFDGGVVILDHDGRVVAADPRRTDAVGQDWSDRSYVRDIASGQDRVLLSEIEYDGGNGEPVVAVALPIRNADGQVLGTVAGMFVVADEATNAFYTSILRYHLRPESHILLVSAGGRTIDYWRSPRVGREGADAASVAALARGESGALRTRDSEGREIIASYAPIPGTSWGLVEHERWDLITMESTRYGRLLLVLLIMGLVVPSGFVALGVRRIMRPVGEVTNAARSLAAGNLDQTIALPRERELAQLADSFNRMSAELRDLYNSLEAKVLARTRELEMLNHLAAELGKTLDVQQTLDVALARTLDMLALGAGLAYRTEPGQGTYRLVASQGVSEGTAQAMHRVMAEPIPWLTGPSSNRPFRNRVTQLGLGASAQHLTEEGWSDAIVVPLAAKDQAVGLLLLGDIRSRDLSDEEIALLEAVAAQAGMAVENGQLYERAEETAVAAERSRLARDLHDSVTQTLFSANLVAGVVPILWETNPEEARRRQREMHVLIGGALAEMRSLLYELRPATLEEAPLTELLAQLCAAAAGRGRLSVELNAPTEPAIGADVRIAFYRIAQEALNNVIKHAAASRATIDLHVGEGGGPPLAMRISDDGRGFDAAGATVGHLGLSIMRERANAIGARLDLDSVPQGGTRLTLTWPSPACTDGD